MRDTAIRNVYASVVSIDGDINATDKDGDSVVLDESLITLEVARLQGLYDALEYSRIRKEKYDLLNQDEMRFDDLVNNTTTWVDAINAIKLAHPKS